MEQKTQKFSGTGHKGFKLIAATLACAMLMTGCAAPVKPVSAGIAVSDINDLASATFDSPVNITWMSDKEVLTTDVTVSQYTDQAPDINIDQDIVNLIPDSDICTLYYFNISAERYDFPIKVTDEAGKRFEFNGRDFDMAVYPLGEGWYCFNMPNSCEACQIMVGNTYFK